MFDSGLGGRDQHHRPRRSPSPAPAIWIPYIASGSYLSGVVAKAVGVLACLFGAFLIWLFLSIDPKSFSVWLRGLLGCGLVIFGFVSFFFLSDDDVMP